jgi:hypothetical protein
MTIAENIERQIKAECRLGSQQFTWNGADYLCAPNAFTYENMVGIGGNPILKEGHLAVRKSLFDGGLPQSQDLISFRSIQYKIGKVQTDPNAIVLVLWLESDSRHA